MKQEKSKNLGMEFSLDNVKMVTYVSRKETNFYAQNYTDRLSYQKIRLSGSITNIQGIRDIARWSVTIAG